MEEADGIRFLMMGLVEGQTLDRLIPENGPSLDKLLDLGAALADALAAAQADALCHIYDLLHAWAYSAADAIGDATTAARQAMALDGAVAYGFLMVTHGVMGNGDAASIAYDRAIRLSPRDHSRLIGLAGRGIAAHIADRYEEALELAGAMIRENANFAPAYRQLAAANARLGRIVEARSAMPRVLELVPGLTVAQVRSMEPLQDPDAQERWPDGLRMAGLPE